MTTMRLLSLSAAFLAVCSIAVAESWQAPGLASVGELRLGGMWAAAQTRNADRMAAPPLDQQKFILADLSLEQIPGRRFVEYSGDISGRWIGAAAFLSPIYPKPFAAFPEIMAQIPGYQKADGHFGADQQLPTIDPKRDTPILWGNGRILIGLVEVYDCTGDKAALEMARKLGDYLVATDPVYNKPENLAVGGTYAEGFVTCYFSVIEGLVAIGRVTKDDRYVNEAKRIADLALTIDNFDGVHCHGRLTAVRAFADLYALTQDTRWRDAAERDWKIFMEQHRLPTAGLKEVLNAGCNRDEGCAQSDWLRLNLSLWHLTGNGRYLDEAERCLKGHFIANQFPNGGSGHRTFYQIGGQPVAFRPEGGEEEAWWCCSKHWARAGVDVARFAVTGGEQGPSVNLIVDCEGMVAGPKGQWRVAVRETEDGAKVSLTSPAKTRTALHIHRPAWTSQGARIEAPATFAVNETKDAWLVEGEWDGLQEVSVHLPMDLRSEAAPGNAAVLLRGHDLLAAHPGPTNAWLLDAMPGGRPTVLWAAALPAKDGRVVVPASMDPNADPAKPEQWKLMELAPVRSTAGQPHVAAWFSFNLRGATSEEVMALVNKWCQASSSIWPSSPPEDCPFLPSKSLPSIRFTGRHAEYTEADTWYPSWASDGNLYSPWTDGTVNGLSSMSMMGANATTGYATIVGDDPLALQVNDQGVYVSDPSPYGGRYPCGSLVHEGVWYYGTYCLSGGNTDHEGITYNWPWLGPVVGFRYSTDFGKTWTQTPHTPEKPLFGENGLNGQHPVKIGSPHFVDFGKNMEHSPDGKAYLVCHGAIDADPKPRFANLSWITGDQVYLIRVAPSIENINDASKYEFFAGFDEQQQPIWSKDFSTIKPIAEWNNNMGCVTMTYNASLKRYLMCVTDGTNTTGRFNSYILESDQIAGPWQLVTYLKDFGEQAYFVNVPSKFIAADGRTFWLCYSANFSQGYNGVRFEPRPVGSRYAMCLQEVTIP